MATLEAHQVSKQYRMGSQVAVRALSQVDFEVERGEFVAIMGPSGSGKSTLLHLLGGMDRPTSGEVVMDGQALSTLGERELTLLRRRKIGFVFQFFNLILTLDVEENIMLPRLIDGKTRKSCAGKLEDMLHTVGLEHRRHHRPDQLSGGEQQRVAVARALMAEPNILLADEPTGNLDSGVGLEIIELLKNLSATGRPAIVVATHDARVAEHAHRIAWLIDGKVKTKA